MPPIAKIRRAALAAIILGALAPLFAAAEPETPVPLEEKVERMEEEFARREILSLRRVEGVEVRMETLDRHINRVFLIFALSAAIVLMLVVARQRTSNRLNSERVNRVVRETEMLNADIRRELNRPEMEFLRVGHFLRRTMREFLDSAPAEKNMAEVFSITRDPHAPASLHYTAQALTAEYEKRWRDAESALEQLRQLEPEDPFVLLHLHYVHTRIAEETGDVRHRKRHLQTANQYYAQFAVAAQMRDIPKPPQSSAAPPAPQPAAIPPVDPGLRGNVAMQSPATPQSQIVKPQTAPAPPVRTATPTPPPARMTPPAQSAAPTPAPQPAATPPADSGLRENVAAQSSAAELPASEPQPAAMQAKPFAGYSARDSLGGAFWRKIGGAVKNGSAHLLNEAAGIVGKIGGDVNGGAPPFLPLPAVSEVPADAGAAETAMWQSIREGDLRMAQAAAAFNLRRRNRLIDRALISYEQAQGHKTNETLYLNWGISLLGKALHLPEKKRDPFFNSAIDKFLAGNVIAPHRFDFSLATLYAIIGREMECKRWLQISRESGTLDLESLRRAPDFDGVRRSPWFAEFVRD